MCVVSDCTTDVASKRQQLNYEVVFSSETDRKTGIRDRRSSYFESFV